MSEYVNLKLEKRGHTAVLTLSNPPAHTWTAESLKSLARLVRDLDADDARRGRCCVAHRVSSRGRRVISCGGGRID